MHFLDLIGASVFAVTGLLAARRKQLDLFGAIIIALVTSIGGGTLRDLILGAPVFWTQQNIYIYVVVISALVFFFLARYWLLPSNLLLLLDALGLAVFTVIGTVKAVELGFSDPIAIMAGVMTGVVGGVIRDVLVGEVPMVFRKEIYATASFLGASTLLLLNHFGIDIDIAALVSILLVLVIRVGAIVFNVELPVFISYKAPNFQKDKPCQSNQKKDS